MLSSPIPSFLAIVCFLIGTVLTPARAQEAKPNDLLPNAPGIQNPTPPPLETATVTLDLSIPSLPQPKFDCGSPTFPARRSWSESLAYHTTRALQDLHMKRAGDILINSAREKARRRAKGN